MYTKVHARYKSRGPPGFAKKRKKGRNFIKKGTKRPTSQKTPRTRKKRNTHGAGGTLSWWADLWYQGK